MRRKTTVFITILLLLLLTGVVMAEGGHIEAGDLIESTLAPGTIDTWTFDADAGDEIIIGVSSGDFDPYIELYDPSDTFLIEDDDSGPDSSAILWSYIVADTGTYSLNVRDYFEEDGGEYSIFLYKVNYNGVITYGETLQGQLIGTNLDSWEFDGTAGEIIRIGLSSEDFDTYLTLIDSLYVMAADSDDFGESTNSLIGGYVLPEDGIYTIIVSGYSDQSTGNYDLTIDTMELAPNETLPTQIGNEETGILIGGQYDNWEFEALESQVIDIALSSDDFDTTLELFDENDNSLEYSDDGPDGTNSLIYSFTIPSTGTYYATVSGFDEEEYGLYSLIISETLGGEVYMGEITPGDSFTADLDSGYWHSWDFTITGETYVTFSLQSDDFDAFLELYGPDGYLTDDDDGLDGTDAIILDYLLEEPGTYTVYASGYSSEEAGEYVLTFSTEGDVVTEYMRGPETNIEYNSSGEGFLESGYYDAWLFTATSGDVVSIAVTSDDIDPYIELYGPGDELLEMNDDDGASFNSLIADFVIPADGTYEVSVMGIDFTSTGAYTVSISSDTEQTPEVDLEEGINGLFEEGSVEFITTILEDGSGRFDLAFIINDRDANDLTELLEERDLGDSIEDWCDEVEDTFDDLDVFPNLDDSQYGVSDDAFTCIMIYEFDDIDELEELYEDLGFVDIKDLDIDSDENIDYDLEIELSDLIFDNLFMEDADVDYLWSVIIAGKFQETNADAEEKTKVIWELELDDVVDVEMQAEKGGIPMIFLIGGAGLLVLLVGGGIGAFFLIRGLRKE